MKDWFTIDQIDKDTYVISEYRHWEETHCYLLNGDTYSLLIDTGLGIENIYDEVMKLTNKPVLCIATHIHWDHIGGHKYFPNFYAHEEERDWLQGKFPLPLPVIKNMVLDRCDIPEKFNIDTYELFQGTPTRIFHGEELIDFGNRLVKVLPTPGHSPGHMCFWEENRGYLFTGDLIYLDMLFAYYPSTDPKAYLASLKSLLPLPVKHIYPAHHAFDIDVTIIKRMVEAFSKLEQAGKLHHGSGKYYFEDWSLWL